MQTNYLDFIKKPDISNIKTFVISGDEPLQRFNAIEKITDSFKNKGFEIVRHDLTEQKHDSLYDEADSLSLFAMDKLVQFNIEKPPQKNLQKALIENLTKSSDNVYILVFHGLKKQTLSAKWFQSITNNAEHIHIYQPNFQASINIIKHEITQTNLKLNDNAIALLAQKTEGNLIVTKQILKLLSRQNENNFDEVNIRPFLHEHASFDVFDLSDAILMQQKAKALTILNNILIENDKPPLVLWTLKKELRILSQLKATQNTYYQKIFKDNNIWASKQKYYSSLINKINLSTITNALEKCLDADLYIKGAKKGNIKLTLNEITYSLF